ncbi:MAG: HAMP domain-containing protein [Treponema sp.]|nr:HAMP domain-containing protein [Treponema sp.]
MTIKRRLFLANIRMILITIGGFFAVTLLVRIISFTILLGPWWGDSDLSGIDQFTSPDRIRNLYIISMAPFFAFIFIINSVFTYRMSQKITRPLEILAAGVKEIQSNNFAYRIEYSGDKEFQMLCQAYNDMASRLQDSTEQRRILLAGITHDLRTPLTTIKGYLEGLEVGIASTQEMRDNFLLGIKNKADSMEQIIERLFMFSKLDMEEFPLTLSRVDIMQAITDMLEELREEYTKRGLIISIVDIPKKIFMNTDIMFLSNALINILENSTNYKTKDTGCLVISASLSDGFIQIRFADDGPGVNSDMLNKLFNVFYRTDPSRHKKGSGLGLAISAKIIERLGGTIYAENCNPSGLAITIHLPIETGAVQ